MAYYGNDEDYEDPSEPYGEDEGSMLQQQIAEQEEQLKKAEQNKKFMLEEKLLKNKLKLIFSEVAVGGRMSYKPSEKDTIKKAKAHPNLKKDIAGINLLFLANKAKTTAKAISSSPAMVYVFYGVLILFLIIAVIAIIASIMVWLFPAENGDGTVSSAFGVTGADFYGARMIYADNLKARSSIIENYVEFVEDGIVRAEQITTITAGGEDYKVTLNIDHITTPEEYDYSNFDETEFKTNHQNLYGLVLAVAKNTYKVDNGSDYSGTTLVDCVDGIKYFGFGNMSAVAPFIAEEIITRDSIVAENSQGEAVADLTILGSIEDALEQQLTNMFNSNPAYAIRTEKLFVKDYILESDDARVSGLTKENYVAMIFMAKKDVRFTKFSFAVGNADLTNFEISMGGVAIETDGNNLGTEENQSYIYSSNLANVLANKFTDIDTENLKALSSGMSLFDVVENVDNHSIYLQSAVDANSVSYLTIKKNGVVVNLSNSEAFNFVEWETVWKTAS